MYSVLKIASRKTSLAKIQAYMVGHSIRRFKQEKPIEYVFQESDGDKDLESPLWKMGEKGVFTRVFQNDLLTDKVDMVVHSWKDLDLEGSPHTQVFSVLGRFDQRDLLLFKTSSFTNPGEKITVFTSSPRRQHNLSAFLQEYLPIHLQSRPIHFEPVRGSVQTRIQKWLDSPTTDGMVVAKAAIDRILDTSYPNAMEEEFVELRKFILQTIHTNLFMCIPLSKNPNAAAQGALAVEIRKDRNDLIRLLQKISMEPIRMAAEEERHILGSFGGGCHQKIGVAVLPRVYGKVRIIKGLTDDGLVLDKIELIASHSPRARDISKIWPLRDKGFQFKRYIHNPTPKPPSGNLIVTRVNAWQDNWKQSDLTGILWAAGTKTMKELAKQGLWVSGTMDGLGEYEPMGIEKYLSTPGFKKITHEHSEKIDSQYERVFTYKIELTGEIPDISSKTHFYWMSGYQFDLALSRYPSIIGGHHACGPGITRQHIENRIHKKVDVFLSHQDWIDYHSG